MENISLIPHYIFDPHIKLNKKKSKRGTSFFNYEMDKVIHQCKELNEILLSLNSLEKELYCWFTVDHHITQRQIGVIEGHLEKVLEDKLLEGWEIHVNLIPLESRLSLDNCLAQIERHFVPLRKKYLKEYFGQIVGQRNGLISQALLLEGVRQFPNRYISLYWDGQQLATVYNETVVSPKTWLSLFKEFIHDYDYQGALELLTDIKSESSEYQVIESILHTQLKRMNFAFDEAAQYLKTAMSLVNLNETLVETDEILSRLLSEDMKQKELERIVELFRQIDVYIQTDDVPSFLVRFYRAREAVLFYLLQFGRTNADTAITYKKKSSIYQVFEQLEELYDNWEIDGYYGAYFFLKSKNVASILEVRNKSFIGHSRGSINQKDLWYAFAGTTHTTIAKAKRRFQMDVDLLLRDLGFHVDDNFYSINQFLIQMAERMETGNGYVEEVHMNLIQQISELIYSGNYHSAKVLFSEKVGHSRVLNELLQFGQQLFVLDFSYQSSQGVQNPIELLKQILTISKNVNSEELKYLEGLINTPNKQESFIALLHNYASFLYEQNDMIDFIVLYYRLVEETLLYALGWDINERNYLKYREGAIYNLDFPTWRLTKHYHRYAQALEQYISKIEKKKQITIDQKRQRFENLTSSEAYFASIWLDFKENGIQECIDFRHEGVSGHGFADLTKIELEEKCNGQPPLHLLDSLLTNLDLKPSHSIFELLNKGIIAMLQEEVQKVEMKG
ncbi:hypothetical protein [Metabacillus halosaccharovorans]|uniref:hypothetical protein n=1 Tax=Metabacillus halosaccharovorans TaxID=930124 RepID=UPI00373547E2